MEEPRSICPGCGEEIDPDTCKCGESRSGQCDNHYFSAMGCRCWEGVQAKQMTQFEKLQEQALAEAAKIKCPFSEYVKGLEEMADMLNERLALAHEDLKSQQHGGG